jgi:nicotinamidase-related amidase
MNTALLLLEIQNDYFPNGRIPLEKSLDVGTKAQSILEAYRENKRQIIHVQHISTNPDAAYFLPCTKGAEFHSSVQPLKNEIIVKKHYPNSFKDTTLLNQLIKNQINHVIICGMMTHLTVDATVRAAYDLGFSCTVINDACTAHALNFNGSEISGDYVHSAFMAALETNYASILSSAEFLKRIETRVAEVA